MLTDTAAAAPVGDRERRRHRQRGVAPDPHREPLRRCVLPFSAQAQLCRRHGVPNHRHDDAHRAAAPGTSVRAQISQQRTPVASLNRPGSVAVMGHHGYPTAQDSSHALSRPCLLQPKPENLYRSLEDGPDQAERGASVVAVLVAFTPSSTVHAPPAAPTPGGQSAPPVGGVGWPDKTFRRRAYAAAGRRPAAPRRPTLRSRRGRPRG
jgi:hypothetical protein